MINRRDWLSRAGTVSVSALGGLLGFPSLVSAADYKVLLVIHLDGGNDGNNVLVPTDGAYKDYETARTSVLAIPKDSLLSLNGTAAGHTFGLHPSFKEVAALYNQQRFSFISNVGALVEPSNKETVLSNQVRLPIGLFSHNDQAGFVQGAVEDTTGWGGRGLEQLNSSLRHPCAAIAYGNNRTLVQGRNTAVSYLLGQGVTGWGSANLLNPGSAATQSLNRMGKWQSENIYESSYIRTMAAALSDTELFAKADRYATYSAQDFGPSELGQKIRYVASLLPVFKSMGLRRQVVQINFGGFDTHTKQRGSDSTSQDSLLATLSKVLGALDATNRENGLDQEVLTLVSTEFGRTLRPGSGEGSEHAWGTHWMIMGGAARGGQVYGQFPSLVLGGVDDSDANKNGRLVPYYSTDQLGATVMSWLGLTADRYNDVFPNLKNFPQKTLPIFWG
jgi:uncharacterized protein (DUF1501 family)